MSNILILDAIWFTEFGSTATIGIVRCKTQTGEIKYYIGTGFGHDEKADCERISQRGAKFPNKEGNSLFGSLRNLE